MSFGGDQCGKIITLKRKVRRQVESKRGGLGRANWAGEIELDVTKMRFLCPAKATTAYEAHVQHYSEPWKWILYH